MQFMVVVILDPKAEGLVEIIEMNPFLKTG
jgi:hypothetical protein